jgi:hypothetical protein
MQWNPTLSNFRMAPMTAFMPQMPIQQNIQHQSALNHQSS